MGDVFVPSGDKYRWYILRASSRKDAEDRAFRKLTTDFPGAEVIMIKAFTEKQRQDWLQKTHVTSLFNKEVSSVRPKSKKPGRV